MWHAAIINILTELIDIAWYYDMSHKEKTSEVVTMGIFACNLLIDTFTNLCGNKLQHSEYKESDQISRWCLSLWRTAFLSCLWETVSLKPKDKKQLLQFGMCLTLHGRLRHSCSSVQLFYKLLVIFKSWSLLGVCPSLIMMRIWSAKRSICILLLGLTLRHHIKNLINHTIEHKHVN